VRCRIVRCEAPAAPRLRPVTNSLEKTLTRLLVTASRMIGQGLRALVDHASGSNVSCAVASRGAGLPPRPASALKESLRGKTPSFRIPPRTPTPPPTQHLQSIHERYPSAHTRTRGDTRSPSPSTPICGAGVALTGLTSRATSARYHQPPRPSTPPKLRCITPPHGAACAETPAERGLSPIPGATRRRMRV